MSRLNHTQETFCSRKTEKRENERKSMTGNKRKKREEESFLYHEMKYTTSKYNAAICRS